MRSEGRNGPQIVKFGGSLLDSPTRAELLAVAARRGAVVAPGGGRFADAVREAQSRLGFSDRAAHDMAILAMDQAALALADAAPALELCDTPASLEAAVARGQGALWRPSPMALAAELPQSWDVTSDSLAAWLALRLRATRLVILKAADVPAGAGIEALAAAGLVDAYLPRLLSRFGGAVDVIGPATPEALEAALSAPLRRAA